MYTRIKDYKVYSLLTNKDPMFIHMPMNNTLMSQEAMWAIGYRNYVASDDLSLNLYKKIIKKLKELYKEKTKEDFVDSDIKLAIACVNLKIIKNVH